MPDLAAALDRRLLDVHGVMKEPVSGEALHLGQAIGRNLVVDVLVGADGGVDRVTRVSETFRLRVDSVRDTAPDDGDWLTLDAAVDVGVVVPSDGQYVDRRRGIHMPLIDALRDQLIHGTLLDVERMKEEVSRDPTMTVFDARFSTVRSSRGTRSGVVSSEDLPLSINVRGIVDARTGLELSVAEAVDAGIFDAASGEFIDVTTGERLSLERAVALGLVVADSDEALDQMVVEQTYNIGAVHDALSGRFISPRDAVERGLLDMARGIYVDPATEEALTLAEALERGLIRAEPMQEGGGEVLRWAVKSTHASTLERSRTVFRMRRVRDLSTGEMVDPAEAVDRGILDTTNELYVDIRDGRTMPLHEAFEAGLIEAVEQQTSSGVVQGRPPFNIVAVIDPRDNQQLTVSDAVERHLLNDALTQYVDLHNNRVMSVEEAVSRGYIITDQRDTGGPGPAPVTHDTQSYRIKSVIDPRTGEEIPIADAVRHKIVDKATGTYWNLRTNETIAIDEAIRLGLVITEPVDVAPTKSVQFEMYLLTAVRDPRTGKEFDPVEAERRGLINKLQGVYIDPVTGDKMPIHEAIERNLISGSVVAEADYDDLPAGAYTTVEVTGHVKTSDISGVWDPVSGKQVHTPAYVYHRSK